MSEMFYEATNLQYIPTLDFSKVQYMSNFIYGSFAIRELPSMNTKSLISVDEICRGSQIVTVGEINCENVTTCNNPFSATTSITNFGGFKDLGKAYLTSKSAGDYSYRLVLNQPNLTHESLMNTINKLYDIKSKGCNNQDLILGNTNIAKLTAEEIAIATAKGWNVS
jgi:hypothetical protein